MKILRVIETLNPQYGGPVAMLRSTAKIHAKMGHETDVLTVDAPNVSYLKHEAFRAIAVGPGKYGWGYSPKLSTWLKENISQYDMVIMHGLWRYPSYALSDSIRKRSERNQPNPIFFTIPHGMLDPWFQNWRRRPIKTIRNTIYWHLFENKVIQNADSLLFTTKQEYLLAQSTFRRYRPTNEEMIPYGCLPPPEKTEVIRLLIHDQLPGLENKPYWLFLSRIDVKKGVDLLIESYLKIVKDHSHEKELIPHLIIAGPGTDTAYGKSMLKLASKESERIHFPGMLSGDSKWSAYYNCDAFILPSHQENFGIAVAEALGCGKRVYISDQVNIHHQIVKEQAGVSAPDTKEGTFQLLKVAIKERATMNDDQKMNLSKKCFEKNFNLERTAEKLIQLCGKYSNNDSK